MSHTVVKVLIHIVFTPKHRHHCLNEEICSRLYPYINKIIQNLGCYPYQIGGIEDHIHILCGLGKTISISKLIEEIKISTSKWLKLNYSELSGFYWQSGYGVFSVSLSHFNVIKNYIANQIDHHKPK